MGVILRRGPPQRWRLTLWNTKQDHFEGGQWFRGRIYPEKCDVSPNGKLFIYFAGKFRPRDIAWTWTAVSRPPYLTALALWPIGQPWGGHGVFVDNDTVIVTIGGDRDPGHPPGPLRMIEDSCLKKDDPLRNRKPSRLNAWQWVPALQRAENIIPWRKTFGDLTLGAEGHFSSPRRSLYTLSRADGEPMRHTGLIGISGVDW